MSRPINKMDEDLEKFSKGFAQQAIDETKQIAQDMANAATGMSTPLYGLSVEARVLDKPTGAVVDIEMSETTGAIGTVFGGKKAFEAGLKSKLDAIAKGGGLDSSG